MREMRTAFSYPFVTFGRRPHVLDGYGMPRILSGRKGFAGRCACSAHRWPRPVHRRPRPVPRRARRGLGLFDAMLAIAVLSVLALWGGQIVGDWARERVVTGEARVVSELARAGRLL